MVTVTIAKQGTVGLVQHPDRSKRRPASNRSRPNSLCLPLCDQALAFVKEDVRMITPPSRAALPVFTDDDSKPHAGATVAVLAALAQLQHAIT